MKPTNVSLGLASLAWLLALALGLASMRSLAEGQEVLLPPQIVIQHTSEELQKNLQKPEYKNDFSKATRFVDRILETHVDFDRVSILTLGKFWKTATPEQQIRFKKEFRTLLVRTYTTAFTEYANWTIRYLPLDLAEGDTKAVVRTEILQSGAKPVSINYRMIKINGDWKVYDVLIMDLSLLQNYRKNFTDEVSRTGSLDQLITELAQRNSSALKEPVGANPTKG
ncbi:MAG: ABC transporter substrate-binding protein [Proteobacteria bacterium]|nr:ABC transporter substrate-binding protein [Pseudomonadota bacterium]